MKSSFNGLLIAWASFFGLMQGAAFAAGCGERCCQEGGCCEDGSCEDGACDQTHCTNPECPHGTYQEG